MIDKKLFRLLGEHGKYIFYTVALMVAMLLTNVVVTGCICYIISLAANFQVNKDSFMVFIMPVCIALCGIFIRYGVSRFVGELKDVLGREVKKDLREKVYDKMLKLGVRNSDEMSMAGLTQISMEGIEQLDLYYSSYIPQFFYAMLAPFVLFYITVSIDWRVAVTLLICVPLIPISIILVSKYAKRIFAKYWGKYTSMGDGFLDNVQGLKELKIFKADEYAHQKMNQNSEEFRKITMKVLVMQLFSTTIMDLVAYGGAGIGIALSVSAVIHRNLSPFAALFLILVAVEFFLPLRAFGSAFHVAMNGVGAGNKILDFLETKEQTWGEKTVTDTFMKLNNVSFSYEKERQVLKNVSMEFGKNQMTAIVGKSGCGKSTIVNLLLGVLRTEQGMVMVGNEPLEKLSKEQYYSHLSFVSYNSYLFQTSIRENFMLAHPKVTDEEIYEALEKVNLKQFIEKNGGLDKVLYEEAANISGGQRQRLSLAINLVSDKDIYIFDEATSNIDVESEAIIMKNIQKLAEEKTVIVISHRLENVKSANRIYYMEEGMVKESGTHLQLMEKKGGYAKLYMTQKHLEQGYTEECNE